MSLTKRRISRRALGVVVGASLLVLGLEAPAFAAPTVTSFTPGSGPDGCVMVITGSGFLASPEADTDVNFIAGGAIVDTADAGHYFVISDTEIWATVPGGLTPGDAYTIRVDNLTGTGTASTTTFLSTNNAGACAPTIASFAPACASVGDVVVITGTNLLQDDATNGPVGGDVFFNPYDTGTPAQDPATHVVPDVDDATSLNVIVPSGASDGPLKVDTGIGSPIFSATSFLTPPPDCTAGAVTHARSISLSLKKHLIAKGAVTVADDTAECMAGVPVKIQRRKKGGGWKNVGSTTTNDAGKYKRSIKDKPGKYRALAPKVTLDDDSVCSKDVSPRVRHTH